MRQIIGDNFNTLILTLDLVNSSPPIQLAMERKLVKFKGTNSGVTPTLKWCPNLLFCVGVAIETVRRTTN